MNVTWFLELLASLSAQAVLVILATSWLARDFEVYDDRIELHEILEREDLKSDRSASNSPVVGHRPDPFF
ncbi:MAG: hypothetical protein ACKV2Q_29135 [Planctomycetaceae bacterium]